MFVSTTATSRSYANASTARAVYGPMPGQGAAARRGRRARAAVALDDRRRRVVQVARPTWIAEALPVPQHVAERRRCARRRCRVRRAERQPLRDHPRHLRLLEHHLGDEDPPRIASRPPRQVAQPWRAPGEDVAGIDGRGADPVSADPDRCGCASRSPRRAPDRPVARSASRRLGVRGPHPDLVLAGRRRPTARTTGPTCCRSWRRRACAAHPRPVVDLHLDRGDAERRRATPRRRSACCPASTVAPLRGTSMREAVLIGPSLDQPRGTQ